MINLLSQMSHWLVGWLVSLTTWPVFALTFDTVRSFSTLRCLKCSSFPELPVPNCIFRVGEGLLSICRGKDKFIGYFTIPTIVPLQYELDGLCSVFSISQVIKSKSVLSQKNNLQLITENKWNLEEWRCLWARSHRPYIKRWSEWCVLVCKVLL